MFIYVLLNYNIICPVMLTQANFRIPSYSRHHNLFVIPYFKSNSDNDSILVTALKLPNQLSTALDYFYTQCDTFKS